MPTPRNVLWPWTQEWIICVWPWPTRSRITAKHAEQGIFHIHMYKIQSTHMKFVSLDILQHGTWYCTKFSSKDSLYSRSYAQKAQHFKRLMNLGILVCYFRSEMTMLQPHDKVPMDFTRLVHYLIQLCRSSNGSLSKNKTNKKRLACNTNILGIFSKPTPLCSPLSPPSKTSL